MATFGEELLTRWTVCSHCILSIFISFFPRFWFYFFIVTGKIKRFLPLESPLNQIKMYLIKLWGNVACTVENSYVDKLVVRNSLDFKLLSTLLEFL